jgi:hypothetical protein
MLERRYLREDLARLTYEESLRLFTALWREASSLVRDFPGDWRDDIAPDLALARVLNGLPPHS